MAELTVIDAEPISADVIATLERALERAKEGEFSSVAIAYVFRDGSVGRIWSEMPSVPAMLGSVNRLAHQLNLDADE